MKNLILTSIETKDNGVSFDLKFYDKLTIINGKSGLGKTMLFKAIERDSLLDNKNNIICLDYDDIASGNVQHTLNTAKNKVIIIDNADIALTMAQRIQISMSSINQYIIFSHSTDGYKPSKRSLAELVIQDNKGRLRYPLLKEV